MAGAAWLVPVVTVVSMDSASAASSPPPSSGGTSVRGSAERGSGSTGSGEPPASTLAFTGSDTASAPPSGLATAAAGAAAITAAARCGEPSGPEDRAPDGAAPRRGDIA